MAMRPRVPGGANNSTGSRPQGPAVPPVYEDFKPTSEWIQDQESDILLIYLPGFTKENMKISTEGRNILRLRGERLVTANKWQRFQEDFHVPDYCNLRGTRARFEGGILTIRVPKKTTTPPTTKEESKPTTPTTSSQKIPEVPKDRVSQKVQETIPPKTSATIPNQENKAKNFQASPIPPKPISPVPPKAPYPMSQKVQENNPPTSENQETLNEGANKVAKPELVERKIQDSERNEAQKTSFVGEYKTKYPEKIETSSGTGNFGVGNYKKAVKSLAELDEERKLLVNMGAAVMVLMALGAYIYHTVKN